MLNLLASIIFAPSAYIFNDLLATGDFGLAKMLKEDDLTSSVSLSTKKALFFCFVPAPSKPLHVIKKMIEKSTKNITLFYLLRWWVPQITCVLSFLPTFPMVLNQTYGP